MKFQTYFFKMSFPISILSIIAMAFTIVGCPSPHKPDTEGKARSDNKIDGKDRISPVMIRLIKNVSLHWIKQTARR